MSPTPRSFCYVRSEQDKETNSVSALIIYKSWRIFVLQIIEWENIVTITPFTLWYQYRQESLCHSYLYCIYSNEKLLVYSNNEIVQLEEKRIDNSIFHNKFICLFPNFLLCVIQLTHSCWLIKQKLQKFISFIHELWIMIIYLFQIMSFTKYRK